MSGYGQNPYGITPYGDPPLPTVPVIGIGSVTQFNFSADVKQLVYTGYAAQINGNGNIGSTNASGTVTAINEGSGKIEGN